MLEIGEVGVELGHEQRIAAGQRGDARRAETKGVLAAVAAVRFSAIRAVNSMACWARERSGPWDGNGAMPPAPPRAARAKRPTTTTTGARAVFMVESFEKMPL